MNTIDFSRSYLRFRVDPRAQPAITVTHAMPTTVNNVRINLECRCELVDLRSGRSRVYALGAACKTERVGADCGCWLEPNADFCVAVSDEEFLALKSWARIGMEVAKHPRALGAPQERQSGRSRDAWPDFRLQWRTTRGRHLDSVDAIIAAIRGERPIVARNKYRDADWQVTIEYPVKTINYSELDNVYQTDTGPILLPDLSIDRLARCRRLIECFDLAFAAFNSDGWAEFIVNVPTPIADGISVNHYSHPRRVESVENALLEVMEVVNPLMPHVIGDRMIRTDRAIARVPSDNGSNVAGEDVVKTSQLD